MTKLLVLIGLIALAGSTVRLFLYKSSRISQSEPMRLTLLGLAFLALATASYAQEQERKLVDRLLSPNTKLANPDQNTQFAGGSEAPTRSAATKSFYVSEKNLGKAFVVCVIGGLGSVPGALVGGIVLGIIESFSGQFFGPQHALTVGFVLMLVLLVVKPTGLTGIKGYE